MIKYTNTKLYSINSGPRKRSRLGKFLKLLINNKISSSQWQANLRCFVADISGLNQDTTIEVYPVSQSWTMGTGKFAYVPEVTNGASWNYKDYENGTLWTNGTFNPGTTGSYTSSVTAGGGTWYVTQSLNGELSGSQTFGFYDDKDLNINTTDIVKAWYSGSYPNNGFIIRNETQTPVINSISENTLRNMNFKINFSYRIGKMSFGPTKKKKSVNNDDTKGEGGDAAPAAPQQPMGMPGMRMGGGGGGFSGGGASGSW